MLYAQSYYTTPQFWTLFNKEAYDTCRRTYGGQGVFPDITTKLLLGDDRLARMRGVKRVNLLGIGRDMWTWYASIWGEIFLPRVLHPLLGIDHTGMVVYRQVAL